jgi:predicted aconitase with swiveling domain
MPSKSISGRSVVSGKAKGKILFSSEAISFLGGVDPETGLVVEKNHCLEGKSIKETILVFPHGKGSTVGSYVLYSLAKNNAAPKAIINRIGDPVVVVGAIIGEIPMLIDVNIDLLNDGMMVEVNADRGIITILKP